MLEPKPGMSAKKALRARARLILFLTLAAWLKGDGLALAQDQSLASTPRSTLWEAGVGEGFDKGAEEIGGSVGGGLGMRILGSGHAHDWGLGVAQYGIMLSGVVATDHWYRGNVEFVAQLFGGEQFHPDTAYIVGMTPMLRYNFALGHRVVPFIDAGAGVTFTDIRDGDLSTTTEFNLQLGAGARFFMCDNLALTLQYRFIHLSNAGAASPNLGVNTGSLLLGLAWFF